MPSFDKISITSVMVFECSVCDESLGLCRVYIYSLWEWVGIKIQNPLTNSRKKLE
jgi:hypothetical protein